MSIRPAAGPLTPVKSLPPLQLGHLATEAEPGGRMRDFSKGEHERDWRKRGFTRRDFGRMAALLAAGAYLPFYNEAALAQDLKAIASIPPDAVRLNTNENPMGPCPAAVEAIHKVIPQGGRYLFNETHAFVDAMAAIEGLPVTHVLPAAGSSDPLHRTVL